MTTSLNPAWLSKPMPPVVTPRKMADFDDDEPNDDGNKIIVQQKAKADTFEPSTLEKRVPPPIINVVTPPPQKLNFWDSKFGTVAKWGIGGAALGGISTLIEPISTGILNIFGKSVKELGWVPRAGIVVGVGATIGALVGIIPALLQKSKAEREQSGGYLVETAMASDGTPETRVISSPSTTYINTGGYGSYSSRYRDDGYGYGGYYGGGYGGYGGGRFLEDYLVASALGNALSGGGRDYHHYHYGSPYYGYGYGGRRGTTINNHHYYGGGDDTSHITSTTTHYPSSSSSSSRNSSSGGSGGVFKNADGSSRGMFSSNSKSSRSTPTVRTSGFSSNKFGSTNRGFFGGGSSKSSGRGFGTSTLKSSGGGWRGSSGGSFGSGRSSGGGSKK